MKRSIKPTENDLRMLKDCTVITASLLDNHFDADDTRQAFALLFRTPSGMVTLSGIVKNLEMQITE